MVVRRQQLWEGVAAIPHLLSCSLPCDRAAAHCAAYQISPPHTPSLHPPLAVSLLAPLWVVNATSLAVDAVIVPLDTPPLQAQQSGKAGGLVPRRRASEGFRCGPSLS